MHIYKQAKNKTRMSQQASNCNQKDKYNITDIRLKVNKKIEK